MYIKRHSTLHLDINNSDVPFSSLSANGGCMGVEYSLSIIIKVMQPMVVLVMATVTSESLMFTEVYEVKLIWIIF